MNKNDPGKLESIEGDVFKTIIPLKPIGEAVEETGWDVVRGKLGDRLGKKLGDNEWKILELIWQDPNSMENELKMDCLFHN